ncbi:hypothetical protein BUALT_Bualt12G0094500 [Buddleja alternifolia]|uniref:Transposase Tnp1/En/Spm-like domain-containing protein n=1 Tax=Buddleja alternifolia TaxID=168488 RepID=A0AAV6X0L0_9LAMI|nr:hypothetical protein BUALT_Bualt12G0094500 [Buddleja alternifolia]
MAWAEVEFNTTLLPEAKNVVLSALNEIWRKWKHKIKADYFLPHEDDEDYLSELPTDRIELDQWLDLVKYWQDEEVQKIAAKNADNVGKTECRHRTGRIPFAVLEQENYFKQELSKKPESERTREFKETLFKNAMGENNSRVRSLERRRKRAALAAFGSTTFQQQEDKEEMQKLKNEMKEEREKLEYMKDEFNREKNELLIEKEKVNNLTKKLEMFIGQFSAISSVMSHSAQVPDASSSHGKTINGFTSSPNPPSPEEQIVGRKSNKQKTVQDYYVNSIKIGTRVHLFCHGIPKNIVGQGLVVSMDDDEKKDDHAYVKVYVEKALIPCEKLRRPHEGARVIGEAVHKCIYWDFVGVCPKLDCILP